MGLALPVVTPQVHGGLNHLKSMVSTEKYLHHGSADVSTTWSKWDFDAQGMQVAGVAPTKEHLEANWGPEVKGLQAALILSSHARPNVKTAALIVRNALTDQMLEFDRYRTRENFAFEMLQPDGSVEVLKRIIWRFNHVNPAHSMNRIFLRPGDHYRLDLGDFEHLANEQPQSGVSLRARLNVFLSDKAPDRPLQPAFSRSSLLQSSWQPLGIVVPSTLDEAKNDAQDVNGDVEDDVEVDKTISQVRLFAIDDQTEKPIPIFAVIPGLAIGEEISRRGYCIVEWNVRHWRESTAGTCAWTLQDKDVLPLRFRIEADGYLPGITQLVEQAEGYVSIQVRLVRKPALKVQVIGLNGMPVPQARIAVAMGGQQLSIQDRRVQLTDQRGVHPANPWHAPGIIESDPEGRFLLPPEVVPAIVVVTHQTGYAEVPRRELSDVACTIRLRRWGTIEGKVLWGETPGVHETIQFDASGFLENGISHLISQFGTTTTDANGEFRFDGVRSWPVHVAVQSHFVNARLNSSRVTNIVLGGAGRPVVGQLQGQVEWAGVTISIRQARGRAPSENEEAKAKYLRYPDSVAGKPYHPSAVQVRPDGSFRIDRAPSANYTCTVVGLDGTVLTRQHFYIPPMTNGKSESVFDLGKISLAPTQE